MEALRAILSEKTSAERDFVAMSERVEREADNVRRLETELACSQAALKDHTAICERQMELIDALTRAASLLEACAAVRTTPTEPPADEGECELCAQARADGAPASPRASRPATPVTPTEQSEPNPRPAPPPAPAMASNVSDSVRAHLKLRPGRNFTAREMTEALTPDNGGHTQASRAFHNTVKTALARLRDRGEATAVQSTRGVVYQWKG